MTEQQIAEIEGLRAKTTPGLVDGTASVTTLARMLRDGEAAQKVRATGVEPLRFEADAVFLLALTKAWPSLIADLRRAREALEACHERFIDYGKQHQAKGTADGYRKAERNREMADLCSTALTGEPRT